MDDQYSLLSSDNEDDENDDIKYLHDDNMLPIFLSGQTRGLMNKDVVSMLLHNNGDKVCKAVPTGCDQNAAFIVDIQAEHVKHLKNVLADDLGSWKQTGTKTTLFKSISGRVLEVKQNQLCDEGVYKVTRSYYRNQSSDDLMRIVVYLTGKFVNTDN